MTGMAFVTFQVCSAQRWCYILQCTTILVLYTDEDDGHIIKGVLKAAF